MQGDLRAEDDRLALEEFEDLYENAPCGYLSSALDGTIVKLNGTLSRWLGYERAEILGKRFQDLLSVAGKVYYETHFAPLLAMQGFVNEVAFDLICRDAKRLPVLINSVRREGSEAMPASIRTTVFDATDRRKYERELLEARKEAEKAAHARADFVSMVSHEIRTPLNAIVGITHLLGNTDPTPSQQRYLRILKSSTSNLLNLVNDVLDFSKIEAGRATLEERRFDLRELAQGIVTTLKVKADEKNIACEARIAEGVPGQLLGDPLKIGQVLTNLLGNAIKFTAQGSVTLTIDLQQRMEGAVCLVFAVSDTGIGIHPDQLAHIFEDYSQASYDITAKYGGTGLGLAISRKLVKLHGSDIAVQSEPGKGSRFTFELRLRIAQDEESKSEQVSDIEAPRLSGMKVLIADDNEANVVVLSELLRAWGVTYDTVENGAQAVEALQRSHYDLVLMDLSMPQMTGFEAVRQIRRLSDPKLSAVPIVAVSASTRMGRKADLRANGFSEFVGKPINPELLADVLAQFAR